MLTCFSEHLLSSKRKSDKLLYPVCAIYDPMLVPGSAISEEDWLETKIVMTVPLITEVSSVKGISPK